MIRWPDLWASCDSRASSPTTSDWSQAVLLDACALSPKFVNAYPVTGVLALSLNSLESCRLNRSCMVACKSRVSLFSSWRPCSFRAPKTASLKRSRSSVKPCSFIARVIVAFNPRSSSVKARLSLKDFASVSRRPPLSSGKTCSFSECATVSCRSVTPCSCKAMATASLRPVWKSVKPSSLNVLARVVCMAPLNCASPCSLKTVVTVSRMLVCSCVTPCAFKAALTVSLRLPLSSVKPCSVRVSEMVSCMLAFMFAKPCSFSAAVTVSLKLP
mmetsp:Transcript_72387/g.127915  ORF Transcript_72387/g.127915 Transcript_72387/m.127915 type:complete len:272 (-) Transcript_72387:413-1228(-)